MDIGEGIQSFAESLGADYGGIADLAQARNFIL